MKWKNLFVRNPSEVEKQEKTVVLTAPCNGTVVNLDDVPDEVFSQRMIGDGVAIDPASDTFSSVVDAPYAIFTTFHAISFEGPDDLEIIVHIGLNTVSLKGEGFKKLQEDVEGTVPVNTPLVQVDIEGIKNKNISLLSPIVVSAEKSTIQRVQIIPDIGATITQGDPLLKIHYA